MRKCTKSSHLTKPKQQSTKTFTAEEEETGRHQTSEFWAKLCVCTEPGGRCRPAQQGPRLNTFSRSDLWVAIIIWGPQLHVDGGLRPICLLRPLCVFR